MTADEIRSVLAARPPNCDCADPECSLVCPRASDCPGWFIFNEGPLPVIACCDDCCPAGIDDGDVAKLREAKLALAEARAKFEPDIDMQTGNELPAEYVITHHHIDGDAPGTATITLKGHDPRPKGAAWLLQVHLTLQEYETISAYAADVAEFLKVCALETIAADKDNHRRWRDIERRAAERAAARKKDPT